MLVSKCRISVQHPITGVYFFQRSPAQLPKMFAISCHILRHFSLHFTQFINSYHGF
jgi:hypothetical protein